MSGGGDGDGGPDLIMTSSCWLGAQRKCCFTLCLPHPPPLYSLSKLPSELFMNTDNSGQERLAYVQEWQRGRRDMSLTWEPLFSPQEVRSKEIFLCQLPFCFFQSGKNTLAHSQKMVEPTSTEAARLGMQVRGLFSRPTVGPLVLSALWSSY